jgi:hypothetical protein
MGRRWSSVALGGGRGRSDGVLIVYLFLFIIGKVKDKD